MCRFRSIFTCIYFIYCTHIFKLINLHTYTVSPCITIPANMQNKTVNLKVDEGIKYINVVFSRKKILPYFQVMMLYLEMFARKGNTLLPAVALVGLKKSECACVSVGSSPSYNRVMQITQETIARCGGIVY